MLNQKILHSGLKSQIKNIGILNPSLIYIKNKNICKTMSYKYWNLFYQNFEKILSILPYHKYTCESIFYGDFNTISNSLLYGPKGFPFETLIEYSISKLFSCDFPIQKRYPLWNDTLPYIETNYYFCIDTEHPEFPKDIQSLTDFIKHIVQTKCIYLDRHIIVLKNIDAIANKNTCFIFRVLLERFSQNAFFICTTHQHQLIERPLLSRMQAYRIPLPTTQQIQDILKYINPDFNETVTIRNLAFILFHLDNLPKQLLNYPPLKDTLHQSLTPTEIRQLSYKLFQYKISISELISDCMSYIDDNHQKIKWIEQTSKIELCAKKTDPNKICFFIELILSIFEEYKIK